MGVEVADSIKFKSHVKLALIGKLTDSLRSLKATASFSYDGDGDSFDAAAKEVNANSAASLLSRAKQIEREILCLQELDVSRRETVSEGAVVRLMIAGEEEIFFIVPADCFSGFETVVVEGVKVSTLTTKAPLYEAVAGLKEGEEASFRNSTVSVLEVL